MLDLAREALAEDPYLTGWRTRRASSNGVDPAVTNSRFVAEAAVSYSYYAADNDASDEHRQHADRVGR